MSQRQKSGNSVWFTRRDGETKGPFPTGMVRRFVLLGRVRLEDEVSPDGEQWLPVEQVDALIPEEMKHLETEEDWARLERARMREDERTGDRRASRASGVASERRRGTDRRQPEAEFLQHHRERWQELTPSVQARSGYGVPAMAVVLILVALAGSGWYVYRHAPRQEAAGAECGAPPAAGINWSNCKLEGIRIGGAVLQRARIDNADLRGADLHGADLRRSNLAYTNLSTADLSYADLGQASLVGAGLRKSDLSYARLQGADLSYADLRGAAVGGADLRGVRLDKAIWLDGTVCARGSVGRCR